MPVGVERINVDTRNNADMYTYAPWSAEHMLTPLRVYSRPRYCIVWTDKGGRSTPAAVAFFQGTHQLPASPVPPFRPLSGAEPLRDGCSNASCIYLDRGQLSEALLHKAMMQRDCAGQAGNGFSFQYPRGYAVSLSDDNSYPDHHPAPEVTGHYYTTPSPSAGHRNKRRGLVKRRRAILDPASDYW